MVGVRPVADHGLDPTHVHIRRQFLRVEVPDPADLGHRHLAARADHLSVPHLDGSRVALQQMGADCRHAPRQHLARARGRPAGHHHRARCIGAGRIGRLPGVAVNQRDVRRVDPQHGVGDLGKGGFHSLAVRLNADANLKPAVGGQLDPGLLVTRRHLHAPAREHRCAVRGLFGKAAEAEADQLAVGLAPFLAGAHRLDVDHARGAADGLRVIP